MKNIFLIAGERSGDNIGGALIKELKTLYPNSTIQGIGGSAMVEAGLIKLVDISQMSIIGYWQVIKNFFTFKKLFNQIINLIITKKPDIIITIDSPGLNYRIAKKLRSLNYQGKIIHYVAPTVWAYKPKRAYKFAEIFDGLICILPFEPPYFEKAGFKLHDVNNRITEKTVIYVGHPLVEIYKESMSSVDRDHMGNEHGETRKNQMISSDLSTGVDSRNSKESADFQGETRGAYLNVGEHGETRKNQMISSDLSTGVDSRNSKESADFQGETRGAYLNVGEHGETRKNQMISFEFRRGYILVTPGSRTQEINYLMPIFVKVLEKISKESDIGIKFLTTERCRSILESHLHGLSFKYQICSDEQDKVEILKNATMVISKSGTITLDAALAGSVQVMCYKIDFLTAFIAKMLVKSKFFALPNIILNNEIITELVQDRLNVESLYQEVKNLLNNKEIIRQQKEAISSICKILGSEELKSPSQKAAEFISNFLKYSSLY
jgi:lipid A disaccharide synthetase